MRQRWQPNLLTDQLSALVTVKAHSLRALHSKPELLVDLNELAFEVLILCCHLLGAIVFNAFFNDHIALVTANDLVFAGRLVTGKFLLEHFLLTSIVGAHDGGVAALPLMPFQVQVLDDLLTAFVRILTASLDHCELLLEERMGID